MKLKTKANLAMGAFLCACLIPSLGMLVLPAGEAAANQTLAAVPSLTTADGALNPDVLQELTDYTADHFALRQQMITTNALLEGAVFGVSAEEKVTLGREGWLFYTETVDDYLHTNALTARQLNGAARTLALLDEYAQARGARLLFTAAPNKASLYPQYLPRVGTPLEGEDDIDRLVPLLEEQGVEYVDLFAVFRAQEETLYYRQDSHWTVRGAALAHDALIAVLEPEGAAPFFTGCWQAGQGHRGGRYAMLYPTGVSLEEDAVFDRAFTFSYTRAVRSAEDQRIETENPARSGSLLMFRDSFGNDLYPFLAEEYAHALFSRSMPYQMSLLDETGADTVVIELVERNLDYLALYAPIFPAPQRQLNGVPAAGSASARLTAEDDGLLEGYLRLEGTLAGPVDETTPIYVLLGQTLYEASPVGEGEIPLTLYVPRAAQLEELQILYFETGAQCACGGTLL